MCQWPHQAATVAACMHVPQEESGTRDVRYSQSVSDSVDNTGDMPLLHKGMSPETHALCSDLVKKGRQTYRWCASVRTAAQYDTSVTIHRHYWDLTTVS